MSEENIKKMYEAIADILSERENVKITVTVKRREEAA